MRSRGFWCRWLMRFRRVTGLKADEVQRVLVQMADEVPEGPGAES